MKRILVGAALVVLLAALVWLHGYYLQAAVVIISLIVEYEMLKTMRSAGVKPVGVVLFAYTLLLFPVYLWGGLAAVLVLQMLAICLIFIAGVIFDAYDFESIFSSVFTIYYPQLFFVFLYMIVTLPDVALSRLILLVAFTAAAMTDIFAYFIGTFCGKKKLCPNISPKKTVEGALGGILGGVIGVEIIAILFDRGRMHLIEYAIFGIVLSILAQVGDLSASVIKRRYGVKDFGSILPGHGGMLDRLDSTLFILPIVILYYKVYLGF